MISHTHLQGNWIMNSFVFCSPTFSVSPIILKDYKVFLFKHTCTKVLLPDEYSFIWACPVTQFNHAMAKKKNIKFKNKKINKNKNTVGKAPSFVQIRYFFRKIMKKASFYFSFSFLLFLKNKINNFQPLTNFLEIPHEDSTTIFFFFFFFFWGPSTKYWKSKFKLPPATLKFCSLTSPDNPKYCIKKKKKS